MNFFSVVTGNTEPGWSNALLIAVTLLGGLGGGLLVEGFKWLHRWRLRPVIEAQADPEKDGGCLSSNKTTGNGKATYARLCVKNTGRGPAKRVLCFFSRVTVRDEAGNDYTFDDDTLAARWAYRDHEPRDIPSGAKFYVDVYAVFDFQNPGEFLAKEQGNRQSQAMLLNAEGHR